MDIAADEADEAALAADEAAPLDEAEPLAALTAELPEAEAPIQEVEEPCSARH